MLLGHCFQAQNHCPVHCPMAAFVLHFVILGGRCSCERCPQFEDIQSRKYMTHIQMLQWNMRVMDRLKLKMFFGIWNLRHIIHPAIALMAKWSVIIATWNILVIGHGRLLQMFLPKNRCKTEVLWVHWCFVDGSQPKMAIFWARWMTCSDANRGSFRCGAKFIELLMLDT